MAAPSLWLPGLLFPRSLNSPLHSSSPASVVLAISWPYSCMQRASLPCLSAALHAVIHRLVIPACWGPGEDLGDFSHTGALWEPSCSPAPAGGDPIKVFFVFFVIDPFPSYHALSLAVSFTARSGLWVILSILCSSQFKALLMRSVILLAKILLPCLGRYFLSSKQMVLCKKGAVVVESKSLWPSLVLQLLLSLYCQCPPCTLSLHWQN